MSIRSGCGVQGLTGGCMVVRLSMLVRLFSATSVMRGRRFVFSLGDDGSTKFAYRSRGESARAEKLLNRVQLVETRPATALGGWVSFEPGNIGGVEPTPQGVGCWNGIYEVCGNLAADFLERRSPRI